MEQVLRNVFCAGPYEWFETIQQLCIQCYIVSGLSSLSFKCCHRTLTIGGSITVILPNGGTPV